MYRALVLCVCLALFPAIVVAAEDVKSDPPSVTKPSEAKPSEAKPSEAKELSGMSIVGNDEAPKSLYIVPWKSSEVGVETSLKTMLNESDVPVDRDVFKRQIGFYQASTSK
jgi:hypothetical protein